MGEVTRRGWAPGCRLSFNAPHFCYTDGRAGHAPACHYEPCGAYVGQDDATHTHISGNAAREAVEKLDRPQFVDVFVDDSQNAPDDAPKMLN